MRLSATAIACLAACVCALPGRLALAQGAGANCAVGGGRAATRQTPAELVPAVARTFGIGADLAREASYVRCVGPTLMACWVGANLDCGKADTRRSLPGATAYCRANPGSESVPLVATGHDTIYDWRCVGRRAVAGKILAKVDRQGFIAGNWKKVR